MAAPKAKRKKYSSKARKRSRTTRSQVSEVVSITSAVAPEPVTDVITEKTYITTEPEVEIRKPATLAQALTERAFVVVKPKKQIRKEIRETRRRA